jgi:transcriptional regulator with XRE-family HTH domain
MGGCLYSSPRKEEAVMFGDYVKDLRLKQGKSLREFCKAVEEDPSNWSKIERNQMPPPQDVNRIFKVADALGITEPDERGELAEMAAVSAGNIPEYLMTNQDVINNLPAFLRTIDNVKPTREEFEKLIEKLQEGR